MIADRLAVPCRFPGCGAGVGEHCLSPSGRNRPRDFHACRVADANARGRDPAVEVEVLKRTAGRLRAFLVFAEAGSAAPRTGVPIAVCVGTHQTVGQSLLDHLCLIGAAEKGRVNRRCQGWHLTDFGRRMQAVALVEAA